MKRSLLNLATSMALSGSVFSGSVLPTQAFADELAATDNASSNNETTETYLLPGMGIGAATGTVIAGPAGLLIGGILGAAIGSSQEVTYAHEAITVDDVKTVPASKKATKNIAPVHSNQLADITATETDNTLYVANAGPINSLIDDKTDSPQEKLMNILVTDLSLDVYFRSGSSDIERFYPARLSAIANLMQTMDKLQLHLDGYTDRRGDMSQNIALANDRIEKVRQQLIDAGVSENRIVSKAFGEVKMVSAAGDLDAYTFDRKVVIRFERMSADSSMPLATAPSEAVHQEATAETEIANANTRF